MYESKNQRKWTSVVYVYNLRTCRPRQGDCLSQEFTVH